MSEYDGSFKINTEIITENAEKSLAGIEKQIADLSNKLSGSSFDGLKEGIKGYVQELNSLVNSLRSANAEMKKAGDSKTGRLFDIQSSIDFVRGGMQANAGDSQFMATARAELEALMKMRAEELGLIKQSSTAQRQVANEVTKTAQGQEKANKETKKTSNSFLVMSKSAGHSTNAVEKLINRIVGLAKRVFIFSVVTRAFRTMVSGIGTSLQDFAKYDNETMQTMNALKTSIAGFQNELVSAFAPIINFVVPVLNLMIDKITETVNAIGQFIAYLSGAKTYKKLTTQTQQYANSIKSVGNNAKEASKSLAQFDKLNNITSNNGGSAGTGASANKGNANGMTTQAIDANIAGLAEKLKNGEYGELGKIASDFVAGLLDELSEKIENAPWEDIGASIVAFFEGIEWGTLLGKSENLLLKASTGIIKMINGAIKKITKDDISFNKLKTEFEKAFESENWDELQLAWDELIVTVSETKFVANVGDAILVIEGNTNKLFEKSGLNFDLTGWLKEQWKKMVADSNKGNLPALFKDRDEFLAVLFPWSADGWNFSDIILGALFPQTLGVQIGQSFSNPWDTAKKTIENIIKGNPIAIWANLFSNKKDESKPTAQSIYNNLKENIQSIAKSKKIDVSGVLTINDKSVKSEFSKVSETAGTTVKKVSEKVAGIRNAFYNTLNDTSSAIKKPINAIIAVMNKLIKNLQDGINNHVIKGLNAIKFSIPKYVGGAMGGKTFNLGLKSISLGSIPKLATGGTITGETLIRAGEQSKREVVLPLERNTEWADIIVDKSRESNADIIAELKEENRYLREIANKNFAISAREVFKAVQQESRENYYRTGRFGLAGG